MKIAVKQMKMREAQRNAFKNNGEKIPSYFYKVVGGLKKFYKPSHSTLYMDIKYNKNGYCKTLAQAKKLAEKISGVRSIAWIVKYVK